MKMFLRKNIVNRFISRRYTCTTIAATTTTTAASNNIAHVTNSYTHTEPITNVKTADYDIIINGGGIVGAVFASKLLSLLKLRDSSSNTRNTFKIGIVDIKEPPSLSDCISKVGPDIRVYALSPASIDTLKSIDTWDYIKERTQPFNSMQVWEGSGPGMITFGNYKSSEELGRIVEDCTIHSALYQAMNDKKYVGNNIDLLFNNTITSMDLKDKNDRDSSPIQLTLSNKATGDKEIISAKLVIGADGANSNIRKLSGMSTWGWGYGQEAVVGTVIVSKKHQTAWQKYLSTGPIALLPLWDDYSSVVWSTNVKEAERLRNLSAEEFVEELNRVLQTPPKTDKWSVHGDKFSSNGNSSNSSSKSSMIGDVLSKVKRELPALADAIMSSALLNEPHGVPPIVKSLHSKRISFPLQFQQAHSYVKPRVALIGDAAHSIHPQAGQGLNLGISDAVCLATILHSCMGKGQDIGDMELVLSQYGNERYAKNLAMMTAVDGLHRIFNDSSLCGIKYSDYLDHHTILVDSSKYGSILGKGKHFVRSMGMLGLHASGTALKGRIAKVAMGL